MSQEIKTGIFPGMCRSDYLKIKAANISMLIEGARSMQHLKYSIDHPSYEKTDALEFGIAVHMAVFEPSEFPKKVKCGPDARRNSNEWKDFVKSCGKYDTLLKPDDYSRCLCVRDALRKHSIVAEILDSKGVGEMAVVWKDEKTGLYCKGLVDRFCDWKGWPLIPDLKTGRDASPKGFQRAVIDFHYHTKFAWYRDALNAVAKASRRYLWIAVESDPPHAIGIYEPDDELMSEGRKQYRKILDGYAHGLKTGEWPGYSPGVEPLTLPRWAKERIVFE